jgi:cell division protein FtsZ
MAINLDAFESYVKILVIGIGGGGSNAVNEMVDDEMKSIDFWVFNTDAQALATSKSPNRLVLGENVTKGLGAGGEPAVGKTAAEDSLPQIKEILKNYDMVFIAAGEGGGTGTGAAPVVAKAAKEMGILTVAIVTRPFTFEGNARIKKATAGIALLKESVDSLIIVSNDKLMFMNGKSAIKDAFNESDKVLAQSVKTITDLILLPGIINLDFADVRNTLKDKGIALIGFGTGTGPDKAKEAANAAIASPLLEASIKGARSAIVNITGGDGVTLNEAQDAVRYITEVAGGDVNIIFGVQMNPQFEDTMLVSVIATDFADNGTAIENDSIITSRALKGEDTAKGNPSLAPSTNPAQVSDSKRDFSEDDDVLPDFFAKVSAPKSEDNQNLSDNQEEETPSPVPAAPTVPEETEAPQEPVEEDKGESSQNEEEKKEDALGSIFEEKKPEENPASPAPEAADSEEKKGI